MAEAQQIDTEHADALAVSETFSLVKGHHSWYLIENNIAPGYAFIKGWKENDGLVSIEGNKGDGYLVKPLSVLDAEPGQTVRVIYAPADGDDMDDINIENGVKYAIIVKDGTKGPQEVSAVLDLDLNRLKSLKVTGKVADAQIEEAILTLTKTNGTTSTFKLPIKELAFDELITEGLEDIDVDKPMWVHTSYGDGLVTSDMIEVEKIVKASQPLAFSAVYNPKLDRVQVHGKATYEGNVNVKLKGNVIASANCDLTGLFDLELDKKDLLVDDLKEAIGEKLYLEAVDENTTSDAISTYVVDNSGRCENVETYRLGADGETFIVRGYTKPMQEIIMEYLGDKHTIFSDRCGLFEAEFVYDERFEREDGSLQSIKLYPVDGSTESNTVIEYVAPAIPRIDVWADTTIVYKELDGEQIDVESINRVVRIMGALDAAIDRDLKVVVKTTKGRTVFDSIVDPGDDTFTLMLEGASEKAYEIYISDGVVTSTPKRVYVTDIPRYKGRLIAVTDGSRLRLSGNIHDASRKDRENFTYGLGVYNKEGDIIASFEVQEGETFVEDIDVVVFPQDSLWLVFAEASVNFEDENYYRYGLAQEVKVIRQHPVVKSIKTETEDGMVKISGKASANTIVSLENEFGEVITHANTNNLGRFEIEITRSQLNALGQTYLTQGVGDSISTAVPVEEPTTE